MNKEIKEVHCNKCGGERNHYLLHKESRYWTCKIDDNYSIDGTNLYELFECCGCGSVKLRHASWCSEDCEPDGIPVVDEKFYPPSLFRPLPQWIDFQDPQWYFTKLFKEIYSALQNNAPLLAAMGIRSLIEAMMVETIGDQGSFKNNLKKFEEDGYSSKSQNKILTEVLELGHASIHRQYEPNEQQLNLCIDIVENLFETIFIHSEKKSLLHNGVPRRRNKRT